ncbi:hypothetical protein EMPS_06005 [Entomortierella parvispora]|uniref:BHLH domain-containing protein n=1 Tax=Entomortierella parvispora TaxID=205924 RepID=A0A9P3HBM2_9FUNG|nr:hypothetical protein EMPS_06005 [Entomortierella parvispora]
MTATSTASAAPAKNVFRLHGVNVLNRKNVDSISRLTALEKRRATHILDERQRRDTMNQLLAELANLVRESATENQEHQEQQLQQNENGEKKPAVKSNSITTLRNAITEIRRLRSVAGLETSTPPCAASLQAPAPSSANSSRASSPASVSSSPAPQPQQTLPSLVPLAAHHQLQSPPLSPSSPASHKYSSVSPPLRSVHHSSQAPQLPSLFAPHSPASYAPYSPAPAHQYYSHPQQAQYQQQQQQQYHHQQQPYYHHPTQSHYESLPSMSCPSSPAFSTTSTGSSAPSMLLPQPYMQPPPMYQ